uniref:Family with sequence similarity 222 member Ba n=1 Tax=Sander lucioperca TaxID=283035 RepID=A0A8C9XXR7_SANLU
MLACLPGPGDLPLQLLPHTQMNTGYQKWDTTQRMRSAPFPTPAELDAYAKKVANNPLTIKIFPNSVKVPQRNHVRRTVNGLDTSGQRYSPYPSSQASAKTGLLAIIKVPTVKGILKDFDGSRARLHPEVIMNPHTRPYQVASTSTLNHHPPLPNLTRLQQSLPLQPQDPPQTLQMPLPQHQGHTQSLRHPPPMAQPPQGLMGKMHRPPLSRVGPEVGDGRTALIQHPGYR